MIRGLHVVGMFEDFEDGLEPLDAEHVLLLESHD